MSARDCNVAGGNDNASGWHGVLNSCGARNRYGGCDRGYGRDHAADQ